MRPTGSAAVLEARRHHAWALLEDGLSLNAVARRLGCAASSVLRWRNAIRQRGADGFRVDASPGRPPKLTPAERRRLVRLLLRGPLAAGYQTDLWTTARIDFATVSWPTLMVNSGPPVTLTDLTVFARTGRGGAVGQESQSGVVRRNPAGYNLESARSRAWPGCSGCIAARSGRHWRMRGPRSGPIPSVPVPR